MIWPARALAELAFSLSILMPKYIKCIAPPNCKFDMYKRRAKVRDQLHCAVTTDANRKSILAAIAVLEAGW